MFSAAAADRASANEFLQGPGDRVRFEECAAFRERVSTSRDLGGLTIPVGLARCACPSLSVPPVIVC